MAKKKTVKTKSLKRRKTKRNPSANWRAALERSKRKEMMRDAAKARELVFELYSIFRKHAPTPKRSNK